LQGRNNLSLALSPTASRGPKAFRERCRCRATSDVVGSIGHERGALEGKAGGRCVCVVAGGEGGTVHARAAREARGERWRGRTNERESGPVCVSRGGGGGASRRAAHRLRRARRRRAPPVAVPLPSARKRPPCCLTPQSTHSATKTDHNKIREVLSVPRLIIIITPPSLQKNPPPPPFPHHPCTPQTTPRTTRPKPPTTQASTPAAGQTTSPTGRP